MKNRHLYPENWVSEIRPAVLVRDKFKCTICGARQGAKGYYVGIVWHELIDSFQIEWAKRQGHKVVKIALQVMHIDQDVNNNSMENLAAGCPKCHLRTDNIYNAARRLMGRNKR